MVRSISSWSKRLSQVFCSPLNGPGSTFRILITAGVSVDRPDRRAPHRARGSGFAFTRSAFVRILSAIFCRYRLETRRSAFSLIIIWTATPQTMYWFYPFGTAIVDAAVSQAGIVFDHDLIPLERRSGHQAIVPRTRLIAHRRVVAAGVPLHVGIRGIKILETAGQRIHIPGGRSVRYFDRQKLVKIGGQRVGVGPGGRADRRRFGRKITAAARLQRS